MSRPLRLEFAGALYHVTARGNRCEAIYFDDGDRSRFLQLLGEVCTLFNWRLHAYCLLNDHYHLLVETPDGNLSKGMRQLNGVFTQWSNRNHGRSGHLFQGRFKGILIEEELYLLQLARHIVLNPVRTGVTAAVEEWPWSSYPATAGRVPPPPWLATATLLARFGAPAESARVRYTEYVAQGIGQPGPWACLRGQIYLGSDAFVKKMQKLACAQTLAKAPPRSPCRPPPQPLHHYEERTPERDTAIYLAYRSGGYSLKEIGDYFGLHYSRISRIVRKVDGENGGAVRALKQSRVEEEGS